MGLELGPLADTWPQHLPKLQGRPSLCGVQVLPVVNRPSFPIKEAKETEKTQMHTTTNFQADVHLFASTRKGALAWSFPFMDSK